VMLMCYAEQQRYGNKVADYAGKIDGFVPVSDYDAESLLLTQSKQPENSLELYPSQRPLAKQEKQDSFTTCLSLNSFDRISP